MSIRHSSRNTSPIRGSRRHIDDEDNAAEVEAEADVERLTMNTMLNAKRNRDVRGCRGNNSPLDSKYRSIKAGNDKV
jgi:hypothetical protein